MKREDLTLSAGNNKIELITLGAPHLPKMMLIGGVHGDEPEGARVVWDFVEEAQKFENEFKACLLIIPAYNPDGLKLLERTNAHGVDLNRNFPAQDWSAEHRAPRYFPGPKPASEPETQALVAILQKAKPFLVVHCHTYIPQICYTGEASKKWAEVLAQTFGHPVTEDIGYPTPGSLGQYCLLELKTACVCVELPEEVPQKQAFDMLIPGLLEVARRGP